MIFLKEGCILDLKLVLNQIQSNEINAYPLHIKQLSLPSNMECEAIFDPYNQRIKFYGLSVANFDDKILELLKNTYLSSDNCFSKIIVYTYHEKDNPLKAYGFIHEGIIRGFFANHTDAHIWSFFLDPKRAKQSTDQYIQMQYENPYSVLLPKLPLRFTSHIATSEHASEIAALLMDTFEDYPSPIDAEHVKKQIINKSNYFRFVRNSDKNIIAVMSAEIDHKRSSAEMTDCATRPEYQGQGLMRYLLYKLEQDLKSHFNICDLYTLARAGQPGINHVFLKSNYKHTGQLINNCRMPNGWETMNIWCKST